MEKQNKPENKNIHEHHNHINHTHHEHSMHEGHEHHNHSDQVQHNHSAHEGHNHSNHGGHSSHHEHMVGDFKKRFWISLVLAIPISYLSPMIEMLFGYDVNFTGDTL
ncbi:heavy metal translocating P-type ATPase, partial [Salmonella enterica subsp. enterica serovar Typhi]|nr:heavy metal translocating P-type ATPase [Salmonella enterica subsp. enterica serovar Typhi]